MEANAFKERLIEAKKNSEYVKIIFQYPATDRAIVKRGYVIEIFDNGFNFNENIDGEVSYSYNYIVEIKPEKKEENGNIY
jgi:hypothetical protein